MAAILAKKYLCEALLAEGVHHIFGNPGSTEVPFLDALANYPDLNYVLVTHESAAVAMADGYARASGEPGVVSVHTFPGTANALGSLYNARKEGTPLVVLAGQQHSRLLIGEAFLSADVVQMASPFVKWAWQVTSAGDVPVALRRAFKVAMDPPRGPVFLSLPRDLLEEEIEADVPPVARQRLSGRLRPDPAAVAQAARVLAEARSPIIVAGQGVADAGAQQEVAAVAEMLGAPIYYEPFVTSVNSPADHPLVLGGGGLGRGEINAAMAGADVMLAVGSRVFVEFDYPGPRVVPPGLRIVQIDLNPWEIGKNAPVAAGIVGDCAAALAELGEALAPLVDKHAAGDRAARVRARQAEMRAALAEAVQADYEAVPIKPRRLVHELVAALGTDGILVDEGIQTSPYAKRYLPSMRPGSYYANKGGYLSWGLPAAMGVKLARPEAPVAALVGDGCATYGLQSLWTAARYRVPFVAVICNNATYMAVKALLVARGGDAVRLDSYIGTDLGHIDFVTLARGFGVAGERVEQPDDILPALRRGFASGQPYVVDVLLDSSVPDQTGR